MGGIERGLGRKRRRKEEREDDRLEEERWNHFIPEEVPCSGTGFLGKKEAMFS